MSGKILLDTNAVIYALNGGLTLPRADYCISIITEMELFSYSKLTELEEQNIKNLCNYSAI
jgi:predicted nucleic acid-binding protein